MLCFTRSHDVHIQSGMAIPDLLLMSSRIGGNFQRFQDALGILLYKKKKLFRSVIYISRIKKKKGVCERDEWTNEASTCRRLSATVRRCRLLSLFHRSLSSAAVTYRFDKGFGCCCYLFIYLLFKLKKSLQIQFWKFIWFCRGHVLMYF